MSRPAKEGIRLDLSALAPESAMSRPAKEGIRLYLSALTSESDR
jgi:hypothetical protein